MIRIEIEADTPTQLADILKQLGGYAASGTVAAALVETKVEAEEKPAAPKPRAKKSDAAPAATTGSDQTSDAKSAPPAGDFDVEGVDPANKDSVRAYLSASIDILGGPIVTQVFGEFNATSFKSVAPEQYAPMIVRLDELRKAAEAEATEKGA